MPNPQSKAGPDSLNELMRSEPKKKSEKIPGKVTNKTTFLSAACRNGQHYGCYAVNCRCDCGHGIGAE